MGYGDRDYAVQMRFGPGATPRVIKVLVLANAAVWGVQLVTARSVDLARIFGVSTVGLSEEWRLWQPLTYMFLHSVTDLWHILFNMLVLWMFGSEVAARLGTRTFLGLYLGGGVFAGVCYAAFALIGGGVTIPCVGASGAIMAVIVYAGLLDPNRTVLFFFMFPMRLRTLVWLLVGLDLIAFVGVPEGMNDVAHTAHLGGALFGWLHYRYAHALDRFFARMEVKAERQRVEQDVSIRAEVDRLLAKIHAEGLGALSEKEKRFLKRSSRRYEKK